MTELLYRGKRPLSDPEAMEDVEFLLDQGCSISEVARRANVGLTALDKAGIRDKAQREAEAERRYWKELGLSGWGRR